MTYEGELKQAILRWCKDTAVDGVRGMRRGPDGTCKVINLARTEADPNGGPWARRAVCYAQGRSWEEVAHWLGIALPASDESTES